MNMFKLITAIFSLHAFFVVSTSADCHFLVFPKENYGVGKDNTFYTYSSDCDGLSNGKPANIIRSPYMAMLAAKGLILEALLAHGASLVSARLPKR
ncbi:hypothetical protein BV22DRAFT_663953 [Leucogyrophana mollusca]|uniref:Uncharacterized protein n=1 Tax=Leucogyrophana mollusca TaxID=85980 RepID=A0ACB8BA63_9AGAM|nr:hypothetical protein BV22DRAFT_663953 [Leucogyrophana mollusca]